MQDTVAESIGSDLLFSCKIVLYLFYSQKIIEDNPNRLLWLSNEKKNEKKLLTCNTLATSEIGNGVRKILCSA